MSKQDLEPTLPSASVDPSEGDALGELHARLNVSDTAETLDRLKPVFFGIEIPPSNDLMPPIPRAAAKYYYETLSDCTQRK